MTGWALSSDPNEVAAWTMGDDARRGSALIAAFASRFGLAGAAVPSTAADGIVAPAG